MESSRYGRFWPIGFYLLSIQFSVLLFDIYLIIEPPFLSTHSSCYGPDPSLSCKFASCLGRKYKRWRVTRIIFSAPLSNNSRPSIELHRTESNIHLIPVQELHPRLSYPIMCYDWESVSDYYHHRDVWPGGPI